MKGDGGDLVETDYVRLIQFAFCHLFKDVILSFNNLVIEGGNGMYSSKAILESLINYSADTKSTSLNPIGYESHEKWKSMTARSRNIELCGSLQLDFFDQHEVHLGGAVCEDEIRSLLTNHDHWRVGVARDEPRHDRGIGDAQASDALHFQVRPDDGVILDTHPAGA